MEYKVIQKQYLAKMCFVCGTHNDAGLKTKYYVLENDRILGIFHGMDIHQSYPNRMHGGIIAALLDEAVGRALQINEPTAWAVTIELTIKYHKPVPLNQTLYVVGWLSSHGRIFNGEGYIMDLNHHILASCQSKYMRQNAENIVGTVDFDNDWSPDSDPLEIERIDLPK